MSASLFYMYPWAAAQNFRPDARFGVASGFQDPRVIRLQAKFAF